MRHTYVLICYMISILGLPHCFFQVLAINHCVFFPEKLYVKSQTINKKIKVNVWYLSRKAL